MQETGNVRRVSLDAANCEMADQLDTHTMIKNMDAQYSF